MAGKFVCKWVQVHIEYTWHIFISYLAKNYNENLFYLPFVTKLAELCI